MNNTTLYASSKSDHDTQPSNPFVSILDETEGSI